MPLEFNRPPVNEVVIGVHFDRTMSAFRNQHIGLFWEKIRHEFANVQQHPPLGISIDIGSPQIADELFPMPRYWFISNDDIYVIQVEKGAFIFNWRRRGTNPYPGFYESIKPSFDKYYYLFDEFARRELGIPNISIRSCELSYVNRIEPGNLWKGPQDTGKVISSFLLPTTGFDEAQLFNIRCQYGYNVSDDLRISVDVRIDSQPQAPDEPSLFLDIRAMGILEQVAKYDSDEWFVKAHDTIMGCFSKITQDDIQRDHWQRAEET